ncbi:MAG TPA: class I SAM-dependent methyltransferase [Chitinophagales bacterium]|nr:class I SAM-dependent methyltransferase [Chitinophagales bacterium]
MADKKELDFIYSTIDKIFRLSMGEMGDFSCAMYNGDFSLSLEEAQKAKHKFIADSLNIHEGSRVLDLGCGWGALLRYVTRERGAEAVGLTLSGSQAKACRKNGLNVHVKDCRDVKVEDFGTFDAITCIGAFEHFSSPQDMIAGRQQQIYRNFFKSVCSLLPSGGRFYNQTMVFGKNMIPYEQFDIKAPKESDAYVLALIQEEFPASWLPYGWEMVADTASPYFNLAFKSSGRLDYIETIRQWEIRYRKFNLKKYWLYLSMLPKYLYNKDFRYRVAIFQSSPNRECFRREIMDHYRMVFEKA